MSRDDDYYREQAKDAQEMSDRSIGATGKAAWLRIAQSWLALIKRPGQSDQDRFDAAVNKRGAGQDDAIESH